MPDQAAALRLVARDRWGCKLSPAEQLWLVHECLAAGRETAAELRAGTGEIAPWVLAERLGVPITAEDGEYAVGPVRLRARYLPGPPVIQLFTGGVRELQEKMAGRLGPGRVVDLLIAHEVFHHIETTRLGSLAGRYRVVTLKLGPLVLRAGIPAASEIAAHAFAQVWTGIGMFPAVMEE